MLCINRSGLEGIIETALDAAQRRCSHSLEDGVPWLEVAARHDQRFEQMTRVGVLQMRFPETCVSSRSLSVRLGYRPYRWVRYFNEALLVDEETGYAVDTIYDNFN